MHSHASTAACQPHLWLADAAACGCGARTGAESIKKLHYEGVQLFLLLCLTFVLDNAIL